MKINLDKFKETCSCGRKHGIEVQEIIIASGALKSLDIMFDTGILRGYKKPAAICDGNTYQAAEKAWKKLALSCDFIHLPAEGLHADNKGVETVEAALAGRGDEMPDILLAVGAGTIHDLTRYVAHSHNLPFVSIPTAASVDGFLSTVAAMTWNGMKRTMEAGAPIAVIADTDIFAAAPYRLTASGISDLLGKYTALADWKISHLVMGEYICDTVIALEMEAVNKVYGCIDALREGEPKACEELMYALLLSGLAMQMIGNSRPASGAEHHMSHLWEMEVINPHTDALHGEKVAVGLLLVMERYEKIKMAIKKGTCRVKSHVPDESDLLADMFGRKGLLEGLLEENKTELLTEVNCDRLNASLDEIAKVLEELPSYEELRSVMQKGGCCITMEDVHVDADLKEISLQLSPYVRRRMTLVRMAKLLEYK